MNLQEALEKYGLKISDKDREENSERYYSDMGKFNKMVEQSKLLAFGLSRPNQDGEKTAIVLAGQFGAGKTGLAISSTQALSRKGEDVVVIDDDQYRMLFPEVKQIISDIPEYFIPITATGSNAVTPVIMAEAAEKGFNFIFDGTMKNRRILDTMKTWPSDYKKVVKVMATSDIESLLSMFERHAALMKRKMSCRLIGADAHNVAYSGLSDTLKILEQEQIADCIEVYVRGGEINEPSIVYSSEWQENKYRSASEALETERAKDRKRALPTIGKRLEQIKNPIGRVLSQEEQEKVEELEQQLNEIVEQMNPTIDSDIEIW